MSRPSRVILEVELVLSPRTGRATYDDAGSGMTRSPVPAAPDETRNRVAVALSAFAGFTAVAIVASLIAILMSA